MIMELLWNYWNIQSAASPKRVREAPVFVFLFCFEFNFLEENRLRLTKFSGKGLFQRNDAHCSCPLALECFFLIAQLRQKHFLCLRSLIFDTFSKMTRVAPAGISGADNRTDDFIACCGFLWECMKFISTCFEFFSCITGCCG